MAERPPPPSIDHGPAYAWVAVAEADTWRVEVGSPCRAGATKGRQACGAPSVLALNRRRHQFGPRRISDSWWAYCAEHTFGRWVEGGRVMCWVLREVDSR